MRLATGLVLVSALTLSAAQNNQFFDLPAFKAVGYNERTAEGAFDIVIRVDGEAILYVQDKKISYLHLGGAPIQDAGTNYKQGIPRAVFGSFNMVKVAGRGDVSLMELPNDKNDYKAVIRINDKKPGADLYNIHLDWTWNPANPSQAPRGQYTRPLESRDNDPSDYRRGRGGNFEFRGYVDDATVLFIRSDQVREEDLSGRAIRGDRFSFSQPLPAERLRSISVEDVNGRGEVELLEKPWEGNQFTAVVLITDYDRGNSFYSFKLVWSR